jgi:Protein of unknown function (DUF1573)
VVINYRWCLAAVLSCNLALSPQLVSAAELKNHQVAKTPNVEQLHFVQRSLTVSAGANEQEIHATYTFTHVGKDPISLTGSRMTCGCLAVMPGVTNYLPGDTGMVEVVFTIGQRTGLQQKAIYLTTNSAFEPEIPLSLTVHLPEGPRCDPAIVVFPQGQPSSAKTVKVTLLPSSPYRIRSVQSLDEHITAQLISGASALEWTLSVAADAASSPLTTASEINTEPAKKFFVFAKVEQP